MYGIFLGEIFPYERRGYFENSWLAGSLCYILFIALLATIGSFVDGYFSIYYLIDVLFQSTSAKLNVSISIYIGIFLSKLMQN
jgi:hypothetical protein